MAASNLGRVQGGGFFGSTSASTTSIEKTTVQTNGVSPLVGDTVVNANGDLCRITAITEGAYTVTKYGSVKGTKGDKGADYEKPEGGIPRADLSEEVQALLGNDATARAAAEAAANAAEKAQSTANGKQDKLTFDSTPTADSKNPVTSGGVKSALDGKYTKPSTGIPKADLATDVQASLGKADMIIDKGQLLGLIYPIGSIYMSTKNVSPASFLGGIWAKLKDKFLLADGDSFKAGATGGEVNHTLTENEMPAHFHNGYSHMDGWNEKDIFPARTYSQSVTDIHWDESQLQGDNAGLRLTTGVGGNEQHNNMPPYIVVYMWERIS